MPLDQPDKKVLAVMKEHYRQIEDFFRKIVAEGQKTGSFRKIYPPQAVAWQFFITGIGYAMVSLNLGDSTRSNPPSESVSSASPLCRPRLAPQ